jgi:phage terminase large subunit-like protein
MAGEEELLELLQQLDRRKKIYRAEYYAPYDYQLKFHYAEGHGTPGKLATFRALCAANGIGKTLCGCMEDAYHATGSYPDWWKGHRFKNPVSILACGETNESVRDILQKELFGDPTDPTALGTGTVPIDRIGKIVRKSGLPNAFDNVKIRRDDGRWSTIFFRAYEQGWAKFMGTRFEIFHADEEPPEKIWGQLLRALISKPEAIGHLTFTPERGLTALVDRFMNEPAEGQAYINATWRDAPHLVNPDGSLTDMARVLAASMPKHELEMRMNGMPLSGSGMVYGVSDESLMVKPFEIPKHWPQIVGIDFGWDHPFAAARLAWDRDSDCLYLVSEYRESRALPAIHAQAIHAWGRWQPVAWPHDGKKTEMSGKDLISQYREVKLNCLPARATFAPDPGKAEGSGGNSLEGGVMALLTRMETGRFKVFETCPLFFEEKRTYHRKNGLIVALKDDLLSAVRYGMMMLRHAVVDTPQSLGHTATTKSGVSYMSARPGRVRR